MSSQGRTIPRLLLVWSIPAVVAIAVVALLAWRLLTPSDDERAIRDLARRENTVVYEAFLLPPGRNPRTVDDLQPEERSAIAARLPELLGQVYSGALLSAQSVALEGQLETGQNSNPFVRAFELTDLEMSGIDVNGDAGRTRGRAFGSVTFGGSSSPLQFGNWFEYQLERTDDGWRIIAMVGGCLDPYCP